MSVHFGLIASGNQVIKDAAFRNKLNKDLGGHVLCIEMEAAGLMNHFPCIVIRGICDYADSHKNKDWQEYAAVVAAAFAKELLGFLQPSDVERERPVKHILGQVLDAVSQTGTNIKKMSSHLEKKEDLEMLNWIALINYGPQQSDFLARRQRGTGQWLLASTQFEKWKATKNQTMFCPGMPGAGKTIISSILVDHLDQEFQADPTVGLAYIYCNYKRQDDQKINDLLASLLKQLAEQCQPLPASIKELYDYHEARRTRPSADETSKILHIVAATFSKLFIIVDALDECQASSRLHFISELFNLQTRHSANIFATSRFIPEIIDRFNDGLSLEIRATDEDVQMYLESHMEQLRPWILENRHFQEEIKTVIADAADGMFLLAQIYLGFLHDKLTINDIRRSLKNFQKHDRGSSEGQKTEILSHAYDQVMERIDQQQPGLKQLAVKVLSWITCAKRPLSIEELQYALAIKEGEFQLDEGDLPHIGDMVSVCLGLITIDDESSIIRLVHYTTQEYFARTREDWFSNAHTEIAKSCVTCLSFDIFEAGHCSTEDSLYWRSKSTVLYRYAAEHWGYHARCSRIEGDRLILSLLENTYKVSACSQAMFYYRVSRITAETKTTGLHLAAYFGLEISTSKMLKGNTGVDSRDRWGGNPLSLAAENGHDAVVKLLLEKNADIESKDAQFGRTPLSFAARNGHDAVVKLLLEKNADIESKDTQFGRTPLSFAAEHGHNAVVELLLEKNADIESKDTQFGRTPLSFAARNGHDAVVKLLLEKNAAIESQDTNGQTPLSWAAENGHDAVVKLLLEKNADIESQNEDGQTPLSFAAENGHDAMVKLLLEKNAVVDSRKRWGQTPLSWAAEHGHDAVVKLLLENNADIESKDTQFGRTPLSWAAENGHNAVVKLFLDKNAVVESRQ